MDKFDLILLYCFAFAVLLVVSNFYLITHDFEQYSAALWTFSTAAVTGEIVMFSLYQIVKKRNLTIPKWFRNKHQEVNELEGEDEQAKQ